MRLFRILRRMFRKPFRRRLPMPTDDDGWSEADRQRAEEDADAAAISASWHRRSIPGVTDPAAEDARWPLAVGKRHGACGGE